MSVITLGSGAVRGNLLVACVAAASNTSAIAGPSGWTRAVFNQPAGTDATVEASIWWLVVSAAQAGQTSWTFTTSPSVAMAITISEWRSSTGWPDNPVDQVALGDVVAAPNASAWVGSGTAPLTRYVTELWIASLAYKGAGQAEASITPGFVVDQDSAGGAVSMLELSQVAGVVGSPSCSFTIPVAQYWAGCLVAFYAAVPPSSSDGGFGSESQSLVAGSIHIGPSAGTADTGLGTDAAGSVPIKTSAISSSDTGSGSEAHLGPATVIVPRANDAGFGADSGAKITAVLAPGLFINAVTEGFSLSRVGVLGVTGTEQVPLSAAQAVTLVPDVTSSALLMDDELNGVWYSMTKASLTVTNGFMNWNALSQIAGTPVSSTGTAPNDYFGLPLWTQYQHNKPSFPMAFRATAKNTVSSPRTLEFILYKVQLAVLDFTGTVYKGGLGVSYSGTVLLSSVDEAGNNLAQQEFGRIITMPGNVTGAFGVEPFRGV